MVVADGTVQFGGDWGLIVTIAQSGIIGIVLICVLTKKYMVPEWVVREKDAQISELKDANTSLRTLTEQQIIPALVRANQLSADYAQDLADERRRRMRGGDDP